MIAPHYCLHLSFTLPPRRFVGVYHRPTRRVHLFERVARSARARGGTRSADYALDDPALAALIEPELWAQTHEEIELVEEVRPLRWQQGRTPVIAWQQLCQCIVSFLTASRHMVA